MGAASAADRHDPLEARYRRADGLQLRQEASWGADGLAVDRQLLVQTAGLRWVEEIDPLILAVVSCCDGTLPISAVLELLAASHEVPGDDFQKALLPVVDHLVERGILTPCER